MQGGVVLFDLEPSGIMAAGTPAQNGFGAAGKLINFLMSFFNGLGAAMLGFNAQNYGKGDYEKHTPGHAAISYYYDDNIRRLPCLRAAAFDRRRVSVYFYEQREGIAGIDCLRKRLCVYRFRPVLHFGLSYSDTQRGAGAWAERALCWVRE